MRKFNVTVNGIKYQVEVEEIGAAQRGYQQPTNNPAPVIAEQPQQKAESLPADGVKLESPMPGTILRISVTNNSKVKKGDVLFVLEAMKMENDIVSPADGIITLKISEGASVATGDLLAVIA